MKIGEKIIVQRIQGGFYTITTPERITAPEGYVFTGSAASTIVALTTAVFLEEASGDELETKKVA